MFWRDVLRALAGRSGAPVGNDGLTDAERHASAERWRNGAGRTPSKEEMNELRRITPVTRVQAQAAKAQVALSEHLGESVDERIKGDGEVGEVLAMSPAELAARIEEARSSSPAEIVERQKRDRRERAERAAERWNADCWCITCDAMWRDAQEMNGDEQVWMSRRFIVCPDCGNKRCPKANLHGNPCTGSNDVGQVGSAWENVP